MSLSLSLIIFLVGFVTYVAHASPRNLSPQKWITELFLEARNNFILDQQVNPQCRNDFKLYTLHLANQTVWAVRMLESSDWPTLGLLSGITTHLGNWAECMEANGGGVSGQYCLVQAKLNYTLYEEEDYSEELAGVNIKLNDASAWQVMQKFEKNPIYLSRLKVSWALCVPSSCSFRDVSKSLETILVPLFDKNGLNITVNTDPNLCTTSSELKYPFEFYCMTLCYAMLFVTVALTTGYLTFMSGRNSETNCDLLQCFSLEYNFKKLYQTRVSPQYNLIYMTKVVGIVLVLGGHIILAETQAAIFHPEDFEKLFYSYECFAALDSCVDVYSVISGFLLLHFHLDAARQGGGRFVIFKTASQWAKVSALISLHVLFSINVLPYLGEGPLWKKMISSDAERCKQNWWMNILAVMNFYPPETLCMLHSWYLSVHVQLSVLGGILLYAFSKSEKIGIMASMGVFSFGVLWTCQLVYSEAYNSIFLGYMKTLSNLQYEKDFVLYISTSPRIGPFVLGFIAAYFIYKLKQQKIVLSKFQVAMIFFTSSIMAILFAYYRKYFNIQGRQYYFLENAIYASISRSFIILPFVSLFCIYYGSSVCLAKTFLNTVCQHKVWVILGRLVPDVYLIHLPLLLTMIMSRRTYSPNSNEFDVFWQMAAAVYYSFQIAFFWFLFIESPLANLVNLFFVRLTSSYRLVQEKKDMNKQSKNSGNEEKCE